MKKISEKQRLHFIRKSREGTNARARKYERAALLARQIEDEKARRLLLPANAIVKEKYGRFLSLDAPRELDIYDNYQESLAFLLDIRQKFATRSFGAKMRGKPTMADFSTIGRLEPATGLLLAAEVDRWSRSARRKLISFDYHWPPKVREFFDEAGLFELLNIDPQTVKVSNEGAEASRTVRFRSGIKTVGEQVFRFRQELEELVGEPIGPKYRVFDAINEAVGNAIGHAYPSQIGVWPPNIKKRWWLGGAWSNENRVATVQLYDHGVGIPRTLPRSKHWKGIKGLLLPDREKTDVGLIEAALEYRRTSTGQDGRGKGMAQMLDWTKETQKGSLRIMSGKGDFSYLSDGTTKKRTLPVAFCGTLVEWKVPL